MSKHKVQDTGLAHGTSANRLCFQDTKARKKRFPRTFTEDSPYKRVFWLAQNGRDQTSLLFPHV